MAINRTEGESVYITDEGERESRQSEPLYEATRELVKKNLPGPNEGLVVDIGCSDLIATGKLLEEGYNVLGFDLDDTAIASAKKHHPNALLTVADIKELPFSLEDIKKPKVVVLLDILEHLSYDDSVSALKQIREKLGDKHKLIVSMPNISPYSIHTLKEGASVLKNKQRPKTGLFDRTHKIFTDLQGHKKLFEEAGYDVKEQFVTNWGEGVSGENWEWKSEFDDLTKGLESSKKYKAYKLLQKIGVQIVKGVKRVDEDEARMIVSGYQGLYVLSPANIHDKI